MTLSIMALALAVLTGCTAEKEGGFKSIFSGKDAVEGNITEKDGNLVTKVYDIKDFTGIDVSYNTEVIYVQGDTYEVKVKTKEKVFDALKVKNKSGVLTLDFPIGTPDIIKNEKVYLHVTAPVINNFDFSGVSKLYSEGFKAGNLGMDFSGASEVVVGKVECKEADIDCSGAGKLTISVQATEMDIDCSGACNMKGKFQANDIDMDLSGAFQGELDIKSDDLEIEVSGASNIKGSFTGKRIDLECSGSGKIDLNVDCEDLKAENSGVAKVKISGSADNVKVNSSGVSKIDTSKLNQL